MAIVQTRRAAPGVPEVARHSVRGIVGGSEILGLPVVDSRAERIGTLSDIMFDLRNGRIAYGVVSLDRAPHWSERIIAIPWNAMHLDNVAEHMRVNALRDWIQRAPSMQADVMAGLLDHECAVLIHSFFGTKPYWEAGSQQHS
jgi:hypothetical protein